MPTEKVRTKLYFFSCNGNATAFPSLEKATEAAEEYSLDRGYPCEAFLCEDCKNPSCSRGHGAPQKRSSFHIRQSQAPRDIPEDERWSPSRHRALLIRTKEAEALRAAELERIRLAKKELAARHALRAAAKVTKRLARIGGRKDMYYSSLTKEERTARNARAYALRKVREATAGRAVTHVVWSQAQAAA